MITIIRSEIGKLFRMKIMILPILMMLGVIIMNMFDYGTLGYDNSRWRLAYSQKDGELLYGQEGYERNKEVATAYQGEVTDELIEKLHRDYENAPYAELDGSPVYDYTYRFFDAVFGISYEHYLSKEDVWGEVDGTIRYGFTGDWDAYGYIITQFFRFFAIFIIIFASPLFPYERECGMLETVATVKHGGESLLKYKIKAVFITANVILFVVLAILSILHFSKYGFANADVSIQCSGDRQYVTAVLDCTMGELTVFKLLFGIVGCNLILLLTVLVSMLSMTSLASLCVAMVSIWALNYKMVHALVNNDIVNILLAFIPVNALDIDSLIKSVSNKAVLYMVLAGLIAIFVVVSLFIKKLWKTRQFYIKK